MKACDEKLKSGLMEAMKLDNARLEEEIQHGEPHAFSPLFEKRMEKLLQVQRSKGKVYHCVRYVAAAVLVLFLTGGILFIGSENLNASKQSIDILEWTDTFFRFKHTSEHTERISECFDESMITYLPKGFEKIEEAITYSTAWYKYRSEAGKSVSICVLHGGGETVVDNEGVIIEVLLNEAGYEYTRVYKEALGLETYMWMDDEDILYSITGNIGSDEMIKIMNGISYRK